MTRVAQLLTVALCAVFPCASQQTREPRTYFKEIVQLSGKEIRSIEQGWTVAKILPSDDPNEIFVFGAVYVNAEPEEYLKLAMDVNRLRSLPQYLGVKRFGEPPSLSDLDGFSFEHDDVKILRKCKAGDCGVQLPIEAMQAFRRRIDWSKPDAEGQANRELQQMTLDALRRYQHLGNDGLGTYRDQDQPANVSKYFRDLLSRLDALSQYLPELHNFLLNYPKAEAHNIESMFYWERVNFGMKPTLRLNHVATYEPGGPGGEAHAVAIKQLYASHYFQVAVDLSVCVRDTQATRKTGFFLISLRGSRQEGLTGFTGSLLRRLVVSRTRTGQESALSATKRALEKH
jgi:hypothetical protein